MQEMTLDQYGDWVDRRWMGSYPLELRDHFIMTAGLPEEVSEVIEVLFLSVKLAKETGDVSGLLKKWERDGKLDLARLKKELGDVLYYLVRICTAHGIKPSEMLRANVEKIDDRIDRGVLHGSGDNR